MPTYVYRREDGTTFEIEQRITADPLSTCPTTGQPVTRVISGGTGLIFKGSGFYLTDYARKTDGTTSDEKKSTKASENGSTTETKTDTSTTKSATTDAKE